MNHDRTKVRIFVLNSAMPRAARGLFPNRFTLSRRFKMGFREINCSVYGFRDLRLLKWWLSVRFFIYPLTAPPI